MFYYKFFYQTIQCPQKEGGGRIPPPSDVSPTEKHADVTRVKKIVASYIDTLCLHSEMNIQKNGTMCSQCTYIINYCPLILCQ